jgi:hypothetical protein
MQFSLPKAWIYVKQYEDELTSSSIVIDISEMLHVSDKIFIFNPSSNKIVREGIVSLVSLRKAKIDFYSNCVDIELLSIDDVVKHGITADFVKSRLSLIPSETYLYVQTIFSDRARYM